MFSGRHEILKHNGRLFIDREGVAFTNMVNFLRSGKFPIYKDKNEEINFFEELEFWQIPIYEGSNYYYQYSIIKLIIFIIDIKIYLSHRRRE